MDSKDNDFKKKILLTVLGIVALGLASYYVLKGLQTKKLKAKDNEEGSEAEKSEEIVSIDEEEDHRRKELGREKIVNRKSTVN